MGRLTARPGTGRFRPLHAQKQATPMVEGQCYASTIDDWGSNARYFWTSYCRGQRKNSTLVDPALEVTSRVPSLQNDRLEDWTACRKYSETRRRRRRNRDADLPAYYHRVQKLRSHNVFQRCVGRRVYGFRCKRGRERWPTDPATDDQSVGNAVWKKVGIGFLWNPAHRHRQVMSHQEQPCARVTWGAS
jgi:hypothetical protein